MMGHCRELCGRCVRNRCASQGIGRGVMKTFCGVWFCKANSHIGRYCYQYYHNWHYFSFLNLQVRWYFRIFLPSFSPFPLSSTIALKERANSSMRLTFLEWADNLLFPMSLTSHAQMAPDHKGGKGKFYLISVAIFNDNFPEEKQVGWNRSRERPCPLVQPQIPWRKSFQLQNKTSASFGKVLPPIACTEKLFQLEIQKSAKPDIF